MGFGIKTAARQPFGWGSGEQSLALWRIHLEVYPYPPYAEIAESAVRRHAIVALHGRGQPNAPIELVLMVSVSDDDTARVCKRCICHHPARFSKARRRPSITSPLIVTRRPISPMALPPARIRRVMAQTFRSAARELAAQAGSTPSSSTGLRG